MAKIISGREIAAFMAEELKERSSALAAKGHVPTLAIVRVGDKGSDLAYERGVKKTAEKVGAEVRVLTAPEDASEEEVVALVGQANEDAAIDGIMVFLPLPAHISEAAVRAAIKPEKDVDGATDASALSVYKGHGTGFAPCTAAAVVEILKRSGTELSGKNAVIVGRSEVVGKPLSLMLLKENATVTVCHSKTSDLPKVTSGADILVAAIGRAKMLGEDYISEGQTVIDVGINFDESGRMCGDVDFEAAEKKAAAVTPVPGGVGAVTNTILLMHAVEAAEAKFA